MDELMEELNPESLIREVYFRFGEGEPVKFAYTTGNNFSLVLEDGAEEPSVTFSDGKGNEFTIFIKRQDGIQP
jgi:hypothetical protein